MKFKRTTLINTINEQVVRARADARAAFHEELAKYEQAETDWLGSDHRTYFIEAAQTLANKAHAGEVITTQDLKPFQTDWSTDSARRYAFSLKRPVFREPDVTEMQNLASFLETVTDDEVSSSGLRDVGFRNIAQLLRKTA